MASHLSKQLIIDYNYQQSKQLESTIKTIRYQQLQQSSSNIVSIVENKIVCIVDNECSISIIKTIFGRVVIAKRPVCRLRS